MTAPPRPIVLVANVPALGPVFQVDAAAMTEAHESLARRIDLRIAADPQEAADQLSDADILIGWEFPRAGLAALAPRLRWIQLMGAGLDHLLPLDWLPERVTLTTAAGAHAEMAREFFAMAVMMLNNHIPRFATQQREHRHEMAFSGPVAGKTALIIGVGGMGGAAAEALSALGLSVLGVRPSRRPHAAVPEMYGPESLHDLLPRADFVVLAVPLTTANRGMFGAREIALMKPGAGLVTVARDGVVEFDALAAALASGRLSGAVYDLEDPASGRGDARAWATPNLFVLPHCVTNDPAVFRDRVIDVFYRNLDAFLDGGPMPTAVHRNREY